MPSPKEFVGVGSNKFLKKTSYLGYQIPQRKILRMPSAARAFGLLLSISPASATVDAIQCRSIRPGYVRCSETLAMQRPVGLCRELERHWRYRHRSAATSSVARASTQRAPCPLLSFFQNGARVLR